MHVYVCVCVWVSELVCVCVCVTLCVCVYVCVCKIKIFWDYQYSKKQSINCINIPDPCTHMHTTNTCCVSLGGLDTQTTPLLGGKFANNSTSITLTVLAWIFLINQQVSRKGNHNSIDCHICENKQCLEMFTKYSTVTSLNLQWNLPVSSKGPLSQQRMYACSIITILWRSTWYYAKWSFCGLNIISAASTIFSTTEKW